jgi:hypothetical protein
MIRVVCPLEEESAWVICAGPETPSRNEPVKLMVHRAFLAGSSWARGPMEGPEVSGDLRCGREARMSVHQCPKCELRFTWKTELEDHCGKDHPDFRHDYPAASAHRRPAPGPQSTPDP